MPPRQVVGEAVVARFSGSLEVPPPRQSVHLVHRASSRRDHTELSNAMFCGRCFTSAQPSSTGTLRRRQVFPTWSGPGLDERLAFEPKKLCKRHALFAYRLHEQTRHSYLPTPSNHPNSKTVMIFVFMLMKLRQHICQPCTDISPCDSCLYAMFGADHM